MENITIERVNVFISCYVLILIIERELRGLETWKLHCDGRVDLTWQ